MRLTGALMAGLLWWGSGSEAAWGVPIAEPLTTSPGNMGVVVPFAYVGRLGTSGLMVETTPTMLLVRGVVPGSPAALANVPDPRRFRVRLAAINSRSVDELDLTAFLGAFAPLRGEALLTMARKRVGDLSEVLVGPIRVPLSSQGITEQRADWLVSQGRFGEARELPGDTGRMAGQLLLAAHDAVAGGDHRAALKLLSAVPTGDLLYMEAVNVRTRCLEALASEALARADMLAAQGQFTPALQALEAVNAEGSLGTLREMREADWKMALLARAAYRKAETRRRAQAAADAREAAVVRANRRAARGARLARRVAILALRREAAIAEYRRAQRAARHRRKRR